MRLKLTLSYDGGAYAGWQWQDNAVSVQQRVEEAFLKLTGARTRVTGASRTDAGVHALGQVAHADITLNIPPERVAYALNAHLPPDIRVLASREAEADFHARFHAKSKIYEYRIINARCAPAIGRQYAAHVPFALDFDAMRAAARDVVGEHDFFAFMASGSAAKTTVRHMYALELAREKDCILMRIHGNGFLYNMVRILAGTLVDVGKGKLPQDVVRRAYEERSREKVGQTMPAQGLMLVEVLY